MFLAVKNLSACASQFGSRVRILTPVALGICRLLDELLQSKENYSTLIALQSQ